MSKPKVIGETYHGTPFLRRLERTINFWKWLRFFFLFFLISGGAALILWGGTFAPAIQFRRAQTWQEVPCTIQASSVKSIGKRFAFQVEYEFEWNGLECSSREYAFREKYSDDREEIQALVDRYSPNSRHTCFVNSEDTQQSVLNRSNPATFSGALWPGLFFLGGIAGCMYCLRQIMMTLQWRGDSHFAPAPDIEEIADHQEAIRSRKKKLIDAVTIPAPEVSNLAIAVYLLGGLLFAGLMIWWIVDIIQKWPNVSLGIRDLVLLIGGSYLAYRALRPSITQLFVKANPVTDLTLRPNLLRLGKPAEVTWNFRGNTRSIETLTFHLILQQFTMDFRSDRTVLAGQELLKQVIFETDSLATIPSGRFRFVVPELDEATAEMDGLNWYVVVEGIQRGWPVNVLLSFRLPS